GWCFVLVGRCCVMSCRVGGLVDVHELRLAQMLGHRPQQEVDGDGEEQETQEALGAVGTLRLRVGDDELERGHLCASSRRPANRSSSGIGESTMERASS